MLLKAVSTALFNALFLHLKGKVSSIPMRHGVSALITTIIIIVVIAVGGVVIYFLVIAGGQTTTIYPP